MLILYTQTSSSDHFMPATFGVHLLILANPMIPLGDRETHSQSIWPKERKSPRLSFTTFRDLSQYLPKTCMLNNHKALLLYFTKPELNGRVTPWMPTQSGSHYQDRGPRFVQVQCMNDMAHGRMSVYRS